VTNTQAYQQKMEKFFVSKENSFYRIGYWFQVCVVRLFIFVFILLFLLTSGANAINVSGLLNPKKLGNFKN